MTDFQTLQHRRNIVVGGFVLLAFAAFVWMLVKFRNLPLYATQLRSFMIFVYFPDAPGIQKDTPVQYCGYQIGRVLDVDPPKLLADERDRPYHAVRAQIAIENQFQDIPDHARVMIVKRGLGSSYIEITVEPDRVAEGYLKQGFTAYGSVSTASEFFPPGMQKKIEDLVDSVSALSQNTNAIIGDADNRENIKRALDNVAVATAQAVETLKSLQTFSDTGTERLNEAAAKLDNSLSAFENLSEVGTEQIEAVAFSLHDTLKEFRMVLTKIHSGDGSAAKLLNDGRLYENLLDSSRELELALDQIKKWAAEARDKGVRIKW